MNYEWPRLKSTEQKKEEKDWKFSVEQESV